MVQGIAAGRVLLPGVLLFALSSRVNLLYPLCHCLFVLVENSAHICTFQMSYVGDGGECRTTKLDHHDDRDATQPRVAASGGAGAADATDLPIVRSNSAVARGSEMVSDRARDQALWLHARAEASATC